MKPDSSSAVASTDKIHLPEQKDEPSDIDSRNAISGDSDGSPAMSGTALEVNGDPVRTDARTTPIPTPILIIEPDAPVATKTPPSANVTTVPDNPVPTAATPDADNPSDASDPDDWTPPPPGEGIGEQITVGFESIPVDTNSSIEKLQVEVGLQTGTLLLEGGYYTLYPNASPMRLVEDAIVGFARENKIVLNPADYGLPKVVGVYSAVIPAQGTNVLEAADAVFEFMKNDDVFNQKVETVFSEPKDGWLSVYQRNGYFYILYVVVDIGYSGF
ncbi:MAG: hypothetical protein ACYC5K_14070 [Saccharofermentanales bacterium]